MEICFKALGTDIFIIITPDNVSPGIETEIRNFYAKKEKIFSRFDADSELSRLNKNIGKYNSASSDIIEIAQKSLFYYQETKGYFDPRIIEILESIGYDRDFKEVPADRDIAHLDIKCPKRDLTDDLKTDSSKIYFGSRMDFSGIAKGYITDKATEFLRGKGYDNFLIDSGGDVRVSGKDKSKENWKISLEGIEEKNMLLELNNNFPAVATSGITRRKWVKGNQKFHHLINPKNPKEYKFDLKTVTVIGKSCKEVDVWAKSLFLMGKETGLSFANKNGIRSLFLDYQGNAYLSKNIKKNIVQKYG